MPNLTFSDHITIDNHGQFDQEIYRSEIKHAAQSYIDSGFHIVPLCEISDKRNGKEPRYKSWTSREFTAEDIQGNGGIGLKSGTNIDGNYFFVLDIDVDGINNPWTDYIKTKLNICNSAIFQKTASGRSQFFIKTNSKDFSNRKFTVADGQIEFKGKGQQVVIAPSIAIGKYGKGQYRLYGSLDDIPFVDKDVVQALLDELASTNLKSVHQSGSQPFVCESSSGIPEFSEKIHSKRLVYKTHSDEPFEKLYVQESKELLQNYSVFQVLDALEIPYKNGANHLSIICPFHHERHESFTVAKDSGICICHHDNMKYSLVDFLSYVVEDLHGFLYEEFDVKVGEIWNGYISGKSIQELIGVQGQTIEFEDKIGKEEIEFNKTACDAISKILTDYFNYNVIAKTNSGKSQSIINFTKQLGLKMIYLVPYQSMCEQLSKKYGVFGVYKGVSTAEVIEAMSKHDIIMSTYDGLEKIMTEENMSGPHFFPTSYILCIDEQHTMVTHSTFRSRVIRLINSRKTSFKKIIALTGTPEGVLVETESNNENYRTVIFKERNPKPRIQGSYHICKYTDGGDAKFIHHLLSHPVEGKVLIFKNNIDALNTYKQALVENGIPEEQITVLHANEKDNEEYISIVDNELITEKTKYICTSSVINDGINILNRIDAIYFIDCFDMIQLRQFLGRPRNELINVYDFVSGAGESYDGWYDLETGVRLKKEKLRQLAKGLDSYYSEHIEKTSKKLNIIPKIFGKVNEDNGLLYYDRLNDTHSVDEYYLRATELNKINKTMLHHPHRRKEYLKAFEGIDAEVIDVSGDGSFDLTRSKDKLREHYKDKTKGTMALLTSEPKKIMKTYLEKVEPDLLEKHSDKYADLLTGEIDSKAYYEENKKFINNNRSMTILKNYARLHALNIPEAMKLSLCAESKRTVNDFMELINKMILLKIYRNYDGLEKYNRKDMSLLDYEIVRYIAEYVKSHNKIFSVELAAGLNAYLKKKGFKNIYKQAKVMEMAKNVFLLDRKQDKVRVEKKKRKSIDWYKYIRDLTAEDIAEEIEKPYDQEFHEMIDRIVDNDILGKANRVKREFYYGNTPELINRIINPDQQKLDLSA